MPQRSTCSAANRHGSVRHSLLNTEKLLAARNADVPLGSRRAVAPGSETCRKERSVSDGQQGAVTLAPITLHLA